MTTYFAYGANMDPVHMAERCPGARRLGLAVLPDHEFRIAACGYGNAAAAPGREVHGVLWELLPDDELALDDFEGLQDGLYRKNSAMVRTGDGRELRAMLYLPTNPAPGHARPAYLEGIIAVAEELGFPPGYVARLRQLSDSSRGSLHPY